MCEEWGLAHRWDAVARFATWMSGEIIKAEHRRFHFEPPVLRIA